MSVDMYDTKQVSRCAHIWSRVDRELEADVTATVLSQFLLMALQLTIQPLCS